ncbi:hypothetical protein AB0N62_41240 [Streptomyces sp. NPDC093982]|uniref:hypothetical protein n=1 Tax=Streptomyces sp. NPDC093982 TaxID=3155077 RepID=UPI00341F5169
MTQIRHLRLLPWSGPNGQPAHLVTDGTETFLNRLADSMEAEQIQTARTLRDLADSVLVDQLNPSSDELRFMVRRLCESVTDLVNIAESRGQRVPEYEADDGHARGDDGDSQPSEKS